MQSARRRAPEDPIRLCPCGSMQPYGDCCGRMHQGRTEAATAELLMRSRFSAFAVADVAYLLRTWHSSTRPSGLTLDVQQRWTRLDVIATDRGGLFDNMGSVEFRAHYRYQAQTDTLHERSRFVREDGGWAYLGALPLGPGDRRI